MLALLALGGEAEGGDEHHVPAQLVMLREMGL